MKLDVRLFIECSDDAEAQEILSSLCRLLSDFSPTPEITPSRYWKMPNLFEFSLDLGAASMDSFHRLVALEPEGWVHGGEHPDLWSVWNRKEGASFLLPGARWAEIQFTASAP